MDYKEIEKNTRNQHQDPRWHGYRQNRLTASKFGLIVNRVSKFEQLAYQLHNPTTYVSPAMQWGLDHEPLAIARATSLINEITGADLSAQKCGFFIDPDHSYLGASPDALLVNRDGNNEAVIEIKCPVNGPALFDYLNGSTGKANFTYRISQNGVLEWNLKPNSSYYYQILGQMGITGIKKGYFAVLTRDENIHVKLVSFDEDCWRQCVKKLKHFYYKYFVQ